MKITKYIWTFINIFRLWKQGATFPEGYGRFFMFNKIFIDLSKDAFVSIGKNFVFTNGGGIIL